MTEHDPRLDPSPQIAADDAEWDKVCAEEREMTEELGKLQHDIELARQAEKRCEQHEGDQG
jgi:hypothetical protein